MKNKVNWTESEFQPNLVLQLYFCDLNNNKYWISYIWVHEDEVKLYKCEDEVKERFDGVDEVVAYSSAILSLEVLAEIQAAVDHTGDTETYGAKSSD